MKAAGGFYLAKRKLSAPETEERADPRGQCSLGLTLCLYGCIWFPPSYLSFSHYLLGRLFPPLQPLHEFVFIILTLSV